MPERWDCYISSITPFIIVLFGGGEYNRGVNWFQQSVDWFSDGKSSLREQTAEWLLYDSSQSRRSLNIETVRSYSLVNSSHTSASNPTDDRLYSSAKRAINCSFFVNVDWCHPMSDWKRAVEPAYTSLNTSSTAKQRHEFQQASIRDRYH